MQARLCNGKDKPMQLKSRCEANAIAVAMMQQQKQMQLNQCNSGSSNDATETGCKHAANDASTKADAAEANASSSSNDANRYSGSMHSSSRRCNYQGRRSLEANAANDASTKQIQLNQTQYAAAADATTKADAAEANAIAAAASDATTKADASNAAAAPAAEVTNKLVPI
jgi:hypothetical protein